MSHELPEPIATVLEAIYETEVELSQGAKDPASFHHRFWAEVTKVEIAMLKQRADVTLPVFHHPLPAMKTYRAMMCGASVYEDLGDAKIRLRDHDVIELRYWQCPYAQICGKREQPVCMRTHSLAEAADLMSPATFEAIESMEFSAEGNCIVFVQVQFTGDLREIDVEEKVIDERPCLHLTREEAETFMMRTFMVGAEYACYHLPDVNVRSALRTMAERIDAAGLEDHHLSEFPFLRRGLKQWRKGQNAFTRQD